MFWIGEQPRIGKVSLDIHRACQRRSHRFLQHILYVLRVGEGCPAGSAISDGSTEGLAEGSAVPDGSTEGLAEGSRTGGVFCRCIRRFRVTEGLSGGASEGSSVAEGAAVGASEGSAEPDGSGTPPEGSAGCGVATGPSCVPPPKTDSPSVAGVAKLSTFSKPAVCASSPSACGCFPSAANAGIAVICTISANTIKKTTKPFSLADFRSFPFDLIYATSNFYHLQFFVIVNYTCQHTHRVQIFASLHFSANEQ
jgi:hypothetical protein